MNARDNTPLTIRDRIKAHLGSVEQASATVIASAIGEASTPSRVVKELNAMRTDALVECEQRGKKKELVYWLAVPVEAPSSEDAPAAEPELPALPHNFRPGTRKAQVMDLLKPGVQLTVSEMCKRFGLNPGCLDTVIDELFRMRHIKREKPTGGGPYVYFRGSGTPQPQPAVGENTGSDGSGPSTTQPEAVAIPSKTQPEPAGHSLPAPAAWDVSGDAYQEADHEMPTAAGNAYLTPEMQYLAPEDYELPDPDPALLASANRMLAERLAGVAHVLRGSGLPALEDIDEGEDLQPHVAALAGAYQMAQADLNRALLEVVTLRNNCDVQVHEGEDLRQQLEALMRGRSYAANAAGYVMLASKRKPRRYLSKDKACETAKSAVRAGAQRADVFALVQIGRAVKGAEWRPA